MADIYLQGRSMGNFVNPTVIIDSDSAPILQLAAELAQGAPDEEEFVCRCFCWVRDHVRHSVDHDIPIVTCRASDVLQHRTGLCYAKSHLLVALLRASRIPAALVYQRLALDERGTTFCLHGLVAVFLRRYGWYRVDPRGNKPGVSSDFCPPVERLAFTPRLAGEADIPGLFRDPLPNVASALQRYQTIDELVSNLPDLMNFES